jgi:hypothetical protein
VPAAGRATFFHLQAEEREAAVAAGDEATVARMLLQKRRFAERGQDALVDAVDRALRPGDVPALDAR